LSHTYEVSVQKLAQRTGTILYRTVSMNFIIDTFKNQRYKDNVR